jgi:hypothetical protein
MQQQSATLLMRRGDAQESAAHARERQRVLFLPRRHARGADATIHNMSARYACAQTTDIAERRPRGDRSDTAATLILRVCARAAANGREG